ncbi:MAG: CopG family transcriptional regulator [Sphingosinicella sp.]|uniref:CopG family transcriptional regulator n=1 Tax=Sphingosinicella sp. TaxID=1917971 RepID=UPI00403790E3
MRARRIRHQLFLSEDLSERLEALAAKPGASKSSILADALTAWLNRRGASALEDRFGRRLDRLSLALGRVERDGHVLLESLALFIRYELMINAPLPEGDKAARAVGRDRFNAFVARVGEALASGHRTFEYSADEPDEGEDES